jgi:ribosomal protein L12E/L44/L45/RPP1/RPP2
MNAHEYESDTSPTSASLATTIPTPDEDDVSSVDSSMGAAVEPFTVDPTAEDLEDAELDDTEDRDA